MPNLRLCHWSSQFFDLRAPSSIDVPVLNQPGSFSNDDGDGNPDVKKAIGLLRKTTTLHVQTGIHFKTDVFAAVAVVDGDETMVHAILSLLLNAFISVKREIFTT